MRNLVSKIIGDRYKITNIIGVGGMAVVYKATDITNGNIVALKVLKQEFFDDEQFRARFENESRAIAMLSHENIVKIYDVGLSEELYYIVMEYVDGITLKQYIEQQGVITWREAIYFTAQILSALGHAHEMGVVHRDIKPQNIMLLGNGSIRVTDFGIARISTNNTNTMSEKAIGSVHYISPEQVSGNKADYRSDIYATGVILYEMLTGVTPFDAESPVSVALMQLQSAPKTPREINPEIPQGLEEITLKAMNKRPDLRYQSSEEMLADIEKFKKDPSISFEYKYFIDDNPTKYIDAIKTAKTEKSDQEKESRKKYIGAVTGVLAAFVIVALIVAIITAFVLPQRGGSDVKLPDLVGQRLDQQLRDENPNIIIVQAGEEFSDDYEKGLIIKQDPEAGMTIKKGKQVKVTVSKGGKAVEIPDFKDVDLRTAKIKLEALGLVVSSADEYSDTTAQGYVIRTEPAAGESVSEKSSVIIYISKGKEVSTVTLPKFVGMSEDEAVKKLTELSLMSSVKKTDSDQPDGTVIAQSIKEGTQVTQGSAVELTVSNGAKAPRTKQVTFVLPAKDSPYTVVVKLDGQKVYEGTHTNDTKVLKLSLSGSGSKIIEVFVDGQLQNSLSGFINFDE